LDFHMSILFFLHFFHSPCLFCKNFLERDHTIGTLEHLFDGCERHVFVYF
jgi:hypothetical protein